MTPTVNNEYHNDLGDADTNALFTVENVPHFKLNLINY